LFVFFPRFEIFFTFLFSFQKKKKGQLLLSTPSFSLSLTPSLFRDVVVESGPSAASDGVRGSSVAEQEGRQQCCFGVVFVGHDVDCAAVASVALPFFLGASSFCVLLSKLDAAIVVSADRRSC
jgi:hypothetical protein